MGTADFTFAGPRGFVSQRELPRARRAQLSPVGTLAGPNQRSPKPFALMEHDPNFLQNEPKFSYILQSPARVRTIAKVENGILGTVALHSLIPHLIDQNP
jgi:hypothetical protein